MTKLILKTDAAINEHDIDRIAGLFLTDEQTVTYEGASIIVTVASTIDASYMLTELLNDGYEFISVTIK